MTPIPADHHRKRKEAIADVASDLAHTEAPQTSEALSTDPYEPGDEKKLPRMAFMDTPEATRGILHPETDVDIDEQLRQLLLSHLELERRVTHMKYLQMFDKIRIESLATEQQKQKKRDDPKFIRLIAIYLPFGFACMLFILEELIRHFAK